MDRSQIGIVIPALNESSTISSVIKEAVGYGVPIVVNDGSSDNTAVLALELGAVVVTHEQNLGYDEALNSGFKKALEIGCEIVITLDADGQHNPSLIVLFIERINSGADMVIGIRSHRQRMAEHLFAWYTSFFGIKDPLCGMKAYRIEVYKALGHFDSFGSIGTELMLFAVKNGFIFTQVPFDVCERKDGSRFGKAFSGNFKIIIAMLRAMWKL